MEDSRSSPRTSGGQLEDGSCVELMERAQDGRSEQGAGDKKQRMLDDEGS